MTNQISDPTVPAARARTKAYFKFASKTPRGGRGIQRQTKREAHGVPPRPSSFKYNGCSLSHPLRPSPLQNTCFQFINSGRSLVRKFPKSLRWRLQQNKSAKPMASKSEQKKTMSLANAATPALQHNQLTINHHANRHKALKLTINKNMLNVNEIFPWK